ncbi:MAG: hypothetical protein IKQ40_07375 [Lachnospiraceae bacterium]|nr:hypothetical protein [Lachnospiraceae bacterium]
MGKPVRIHKKKSFMFTTRHYSFMSIIGILIGVVCAAVGTALVIYSYNNAGSVAVSYGSIGMFSVILSITGLICGTVSLGERDIYRSAAIAAIALNGFLILSWLVLIVLSFIAV